MPTNVSLTRLRRATLHHQGLTRAAPFGTAKLATLKAIEHLGYVQIDTLAVVERAHHHILWTRIPTYKPVHLERLL
ncbi:MAG: crosslink repair DNA glycosylase YcaQ family protein, partial [Pseudohongiellaceae bacterium]